MNKPWIDNFSNSTIGESIGVKGHNNFERYVDLSKVYILPFERMFDSLMKSHLNVNTHHVLVNTI